MAIGDTIRMEIQWSNTGFPWALNVLHLVDGSSAGMTQQRADDVAGVVSGALGSSALTGDLANQWTCQLVRLQSIDPLEAISFEGTVNVTGTSTSDMLSPQLCVLVLFRTATGRAGRQYMSGFTETANNDQGSPGLLTAIDSTIAFYEAVQSGVAGLTDPFTLGILRRATGVVSAPVLQITRATSSVGLWQIQRRRRDSL